MEILIGTLALAAGLALAAIARAGENRARGEAVGARESAARLAAENDQLRERLADKEAEVARAGTGKGDFEELGKVVGVVKTTVEQVHRQQREGEDAVKQALSATKQQQERMLDSVDRLVGRFASPKRRGSLAEDWLIAALERLELRQGLHFDVQRSTGIGDGGKGLLDVFLMLPSGEEGIALDAKFPWSETIGAAESDDETERLAALKDLSSRLRNHIRDLGKRGYTSATDVKVRSVWLVVPDWYSLELARQADPEIGAFASRQKVGLLPVDGLYEVARALAIVHQMDDWTNKVAAAFSSEAADAKLKALEDLSERVATAVKRFNSAGSALDDIVKLFGANGSVMRHVIAPTEQLAGRAVPELEAGVKPPGEDRASDYAIRVKEKRADLEARLAEREAA